ncbi:MAG TPA: sulfatase [Chthoniobacteraceae bacterium]|nr:sulfatase [Chthoniobacteraceae bacterium]
MNLIYLHTHDSGRFLPPYFPLPGEGNLLRLAAESAVFGSAFSAAPTCCASRSALLTGTWAHQTGMLGLAHRGFSLLYPERHLARVLAGCGYETALAGIQHEAHGPGAAQQLGYTTTLEIDPELAARIDIGDGRTARDHSEAWDLAVADAAARFLMTPRDGPFFLSCGFFNTHRDFPPPPDLSESEKAPGIFPDDAGIRNDWSGYLRSAAIVDRAVGRVLAALRNSGLERNTLVVFTTDHGIAFPRCKATLYDHGIGVALMIRPPGKVRRSRIDALVSQVDLYPTLCDYLSVPFPKWLEGHSLRPLIDGKIDEVREDLFAESTYHAAYEPVRCIRTREYKYIRRFDDGSPVLANVDDGPTKNFYLRERPGEFSSPREMLFELTSDPGEQRNLADQPEYEAVKAKLAQRLRHWMKSTKDPLLNGDVPLPAGAVENLRDSLSATEPVGPAVAV